ncbi:lysine--tRNA ligase [Candidatus Lokiarchaeum ossiferum]|uniref:lysine--tRNA ligase n=1 Tax=Candidatus Lokiarchaeum ossiferum TaxID=2951803 RepID=UPI00352E624B
MENDNDQKSQDEFPIHWLEGLIQKINGRNLSEIALSTGKTPSGHIHLGIMRELLVCDAIKRIFEEKGKIVHFRLFIDSLDAAKRFPGYIKEDYAKKNIGKPFALIPNPINQNDKNYAQYFGEELESIFPLFGIGAKIVWTHELYKTKEMKDMIRIGLKKNEEVKRIVAKYLTASMSEEQKDIYLEQQKTWMGAMVICEKCQCTQKKQKDGTISPNRVLEYDQKSDSCYYQCPACGYKGSVGIESGLVKLNWRLDWPAKWTIFKTTCEPAGKDHCTPGGSYDTGLDLCKNIYGYEGPIKLSYEWLRLGDRDMKTSKGIVFTPAKFLEMVDPKILRMLIFQTNPNKHISIRIEELEQYYNEYQRIERIFFGKEESTETEKKEVEFIYPLIQVDKVPKEFPAQIPLKLVTVLAQLKSVLKEEIIFSKAKEYLISNGNTSNLSIEEFRIIIKRALNWIDEMQRIINTEKDPGKVKKLKQKTEIFTFVPEITQNIRKNLDQSQVDALKSFLDHSKEMAAFTEENVKNVMMSIREKLNIKPMKIFQAFYRIFLDAKKGPRLGPLMTMLDKSWIENRIKEAIQE